MGKNKFPKYALLVAIIAIVALFALLVLPNLQMGFTTTGCTNDSQCGDDDPGTFDSCQESEGTCFNGKVFCGNYECCQDFSYYYDKLSCPTGQTCNVNVCEADISGNGNDKVHLLPTALAGIALASAFLVGLYAWKKK